jgi:hypothetical protein
MTPTAQNRVICERRRLVGGNDRVEGLARHRSHASYSLKSVILAAAKEGFRPPATAAVVVAVCGQPFALSRHPDPCP